MFDSELLNFHVLLLQLADQRTDQRIPSASAQVQQHKQSSLILVGFPDFELGRNLVLNHQLAVDVALIFGAAEFILF